MSFDDAARSLGTVLHLTAPAVRRAEPRMIAERYLPLGIGAAFLVTVVTVFPTTGLLPAPVSFFAGSGAAGSTAHSSVLPSPPGGEGASSFAYGAGGYSSSAGFGPLGSFGNESSGTSPGEGVTSPPSGPVPSSSGSKSAPTCPLPSPPSTGTPADQVFASLQAACAQLSSMASAPSPTALDAAVPAGLSLPPPTAIVTVVTDHRQGETPIAAGALSSMLRGPVELMVTLPQGYAFTPAFASSLAALATRGVLAQVALLPEAGLPGGPDGFARWAGMTVNAAPGIPLWSLAVDPAAMSPSKLSAYVVAGTAALSSALAAQWRAGRSHDPTAPPQSWEGLDWIGSPPPAGDPLYKGLHPDESMLASTIGFEELLAPALSGDGPGNWPAPALVAVEPGSTGMAL